MTELPPGAIALLEAPLLAHLATFNRDGTVQVNPMHISVEDGRPVLNTAIGRAKDRNLRRDPRCTIEITSADDLEYYVEIRGRAEEHTTDGANEHADELSLLYDGVPFRELGPDEVRVKWYITPDRVLGPAARA